MELKYKTLLLATVSLYSLSVPGAPVDINGMPFVNPLADYPTATQFNIGPSAQPTFTGDLNVPMVFGAYYSSEIVTFENQMIISAPITVLGNHSGAIVFANDGATLNNNIGDNINRFNAVSFDSTFGGSTIQAGRSIYANFIFSSFTDNSVFNNADIIADSATHFNHGSALTFNNSQLISPTINISDNSSPTFNNTYINGTNFNINNNSSPTFIGAKVIAPNGINVTSSPTIKISEEFILTDTKFNLADLSSSKFQGKINMPIIFNGAGNISVEFLENTTITAPVNTIGFYTGSIYFKENNIKVDADLGSAFNYLNSVNFASNNGTIIEGGKNIYTQYLSSNNQDASIINADTYVHDSINIIDNSSVTFNNNIIDVSALNIYGNSSPTFNYSTINTAGDLNIHGSSSPIFNNNSFNISSNLNIFGSATPTFNDSAHTHGLNIAENGSPTFNNLHSSSRMSCYGNSTPTFNGTVTTDDTLIVSQGANANFNGNVSVGGILDIYGCSTHLALSPTSLLTTTFPRKFMLACL